MYSLMENTVFSFLSGCVVQVGRGNDIEVRIAFSRSVARWLHGLILTA